MSQLSCFCAGCPWLWFIFVKCLTTKYVCSTLFYLLCNHLLFHIFFVHTFTLFWCFILINCRLWYEGTLKYLRESVTGTERGIWKKQNGSCMVGYGKQVWDTSGCAGMLTWLYCTCLKVFPVQSVEANDSDIICWCHWHASYIYWGVGIKGSMHETKGFSLGF